MTMPNFSIAGSSLEIQDASKGVIKVDLGWPVAQVLPVNSGFIVRTEPNLGSCENRNVCAIDLEGKLRWKVRHRKHIYDDSPYTNIEIKDGKVNLNNWDGLTVIVDPESFAEEYEFYGR
jgi:hypothetical protein